MKYQTISALAITLGLALATSAASAGEKSDGTRGGGQVVRKDGKLSLKDFRESTICEWEPGTSWRDSARVKPYLVKTLKKVANVNWLFANRYERAAEQVAVCWTGPLKQIDTNDPDAVTLTQPNGVQIAVLLFGSNEIFIDRNLVLEANRHDREFESYLYLHELGHFFIPRSAEMRNTKLLSLVNAIRVHAKKGMTKEIFNFQLTQTEAGQADPTDLFSEPLRADCRNGLSAKLSDESILGAAYRCALSSNGFGEKETALLTNRKALFLDLGDFKKRANQSALTDEKALDAAKTLIAEGHQNLSQLLVSAIESGFEQTGLHLFSALPPVVETHEQHPILNACLNAQNAIFLKTYLEHSTLPKEIRSITTLWSDVLERNVSTGVFETLWNARLLAPNQLLTRWCEIDEALFDFGLSPSLKSQSRIFKTERCYIRETDRPKNVWGRRNYKITEPVISIAIRNGRNDIVHTLAQVPELDATVPSFVEFLPYSEEKYHELSANDDFVVGDPLGVAIIHQNIEAAAVLLAHPKVGPNTTYNWKIAIPGTLQDPGSRFPRNGFRIEAASPLMLSVYFGNVELTRLLLEQPKIDTRQVGNETRFYCHFETPLSCTHYFIATRDTSKDGKMTALELTKATEVNNGPELAKMILEARKK